MSKHLSCKCKSFLLYNQFKFVQHSVKRCIMKQSINKKKSNDPINVVDTVPVCWPSKNHCVVNFHHPSSRNINVLKIIKNMGTVRSSFVKKLDNQITITKVEMSTSNEAVSIWKKFCNTPPVGVIKVIPEANYKKLKKVFSDYWPPHMVDAAIKKNELISGCLRINAKKYTHAFISDYDGRDILINGLIDRNRALDGDLVAVKINDESEWIIGSDNTKKNNLEMLNIETAKLDVNSTDQKQSITNAKNTIFKHSRKTGKIVAILEKRHSRVTTGHIKVNGIKEWDKNQVLFSPIVSTFPRLLLNKSNIKSNLAYTDLDKILYVAKIKEWFVYQSIPSGELCEIIGKSGEVETETKRILIEHDIDDSPFTTKVQTSFPQNLHISPGEESLRKDLRKECIFTIDPSTAKDLDDAVHCKEISNGVFEVGVHIADVSHFVEQGSAVDEAASQRCTSVYLVQKVIPMLPSILSEELCSLNPGSDKLAFSVIWTMTEKGEIMSEWFGKSIICSCAKLSYDHAQIFIDSFLDNSSTKTINANDFPSVTGGFSLSDIQKKVVALHKIAQNLRKHRFNSGALQLDQIRLSYTLSESGLPTGCFAYERKASNELIEELMLLANTAVAHKLYKLDPSHAFLRCHPSPKQDMMDDFVNHCQSIGIVIDSNSSGSLANSISIGCGNDSLSGYRKQALFMLAIKPQQLALYFCAGLEKNKNNFHHFALNIPLYTHFTSPIRRYADIIVHRQLSDVLRLNTKDKNLLTPEFLQQQAELCNTKKYNSKLAQELSTDLFFNLLINNFGPFESDAMIMYVNDRSIDVLSINYGLVKRVFVDAIPGVMFKLIQTTHCSHEINSILLKWTEQINHQEAHSADGPVQYDESAKGVVQHLEIFTVVKVLLQKSDPESATSVKVSLLKPSHD